MRIKVTFQECELAKVANKQKKECKKGACDVKIQNTRGNQTRL